MRAVLWAGRVGVLTDFEALREARNRMRLGERYDNNFTTLDASGN